MSMVMYNKDAEGTINVERIIEKIVEDEGGLHVLCPSGIGDVIWILCKFLNISDKRKVKFWFADGEHHRAGEYCEIVGVDYGYLRGLKTQWVWGRPGSPVIPEGDAWISVQANRHLESGKYLKDWYPGLPLVNPNLRIKSSDREKENFALCFMCAGNYMEGNLNPNTWGKMLSKIHHDIAPVRIVGAFHDVDYAMKVIKCYGNTDGHLFNQPFSRVVAEASKARCMVGVAGGPIISAIYGGTPSLIAYPRWLSRMIGTYEPENSKVISTFVDSIEHAVMGGALNHLLLR